MFITANDKPEEFSSNLMFVKSRCYSDLRFCDIYLLKHRKNEKSYEKFIKNNCEIITKSTGSTFQRFARDTRADGKIQIVFFQARRADAKKSWRRPWRSRLWTEVTSEQQQEDTSKRNRRATER